MSNTILTFAAENTSGSSSVGRASASQAEGREFEPRFPLYLLKIKLFVFFLKPFLFFCVKWGKETSRKLY